MTVSQHDCLLYITNKHRLNLSAERANDDFIQRFTLVDNPNAGHLIGRLTGLTSPTDFSALRQGSGQQAPFTNDLVSSEATVGILRTKTQLT